MDKMLKFHLAKQQDNGLYHPKMFPFSSIPPMISRTTKDKDTALPF